MCRHREKTATYKTGSQAAGEIDLTNILISDLQPPELRRYKSLSFKPPGLWYLVMAALAH